MKKLFSKIAKIGQEISESVDVQSREKGFIVEQFASMKSLENRLNSLANGLKDVNVQAITMDSGYLTAVIKVED